MGRERDEVVVTTDDGTDVINEDDNKLETAVENVVDGNEDDVEEVVVDGIANENGVDADDKEVGKDGVMDEEEVGRGGALEVEIDANALTVMGTVALVTVTDKEALLTRLGSDILAALSALFVTIEEFTLVPREIPELPGVTLAFSSPIGPLL